MFLRRLRKAIAKKQPVTAEKIKENEPVFKLDHIVKERYGVCCIVLYRIVFIVLFCIVLH